MDVFYFNSPPAPANHRDERSLKSKGKPSVKKRKLYSTMDDSPYYAHVVRVAEPTVYANDLASMASPYLGTFLDAGLFLPSGISSPSGNVGVEPAISPHVKRVDRSSDLESFVEGGAPLPPAHGAQSRHSSVPNPRPVSSGLWEEEDGRRIRFALPDENDDHVERIRQWHAPRNGALQNGGLPSSSAQVGHEPGSHLPEYFGRIADIVDLGPSPQSNAAPADGRFPFPLPPPPPLPVFTPSQLLWNDSQLDVGDQKRSYDFADFMDHWRLRARQSDDVPEIRPTTGPSEWRKPLHNYLRQGDSLGMALDMQGLKWGSFGTEEESALRARKLLHPERSIRGAGELTNNASNDGPHYSFRSFATHHRARFSHYQLRNIVAANGRNNVYYADGSKVVQASLSCPSTKITVMELAKPSHSASPFKVTCLATLPADPTSSQADNLLIAGGFNGEYALLDLDLPNFSPPIEGIVSHAKDGIVNHISTFRHRQSGSPCATFCSNDHGVRVMDLNQHRFTGTFEYPTAINCSAMSPGGRLRALVHDGSDAWITSADSGEILMKLEAHKDFAFACSWSHCSRFVATGAEDGQIVIWDARNWSKPLYKLQSVMSCPRSLRFTDDGKLVIAESEDVLSIVETKTFSLRQDVRFFGSIAGVELMNCGEDIVVANADQTVGGLMSFRRVARGCGDGGFGERSDEGGWASRRRSGRRREYQWSVVDGVVV